MIALAPTSHCVFPLSAVQAFDVTRKVTYQHLKDWYKELRVNCEDIPVIVVANKIDVDRKVCVSSCVCGCRCSFGCASVSHCVFLSLLSVCSVCVRRHVDGLRLL